MKLDQVLRLKHKIDFLTTLKCKLGNILHKWQYKPVDIHKLCPKHTCSPCGFEYHLLNFRLLISPLGIFFIFTKKVIVIISILDRCHHSKPMVTHSKNGRNLQYITRVLVDLKINRKITALLRRVTIQTLRNGTHTHAPAHSDNCRTQCSKSQISQLFFFMHNTFHTEWYWIYMWYLHKYCE